MSAFCTKVTYRTLGKYMGGDLNTFDGAQRRVEKMEAALRKCREHWEGTDAPILQVIDEALS